MGGLCFPLCLWPIWSGPDLPQWPIAGKGIQPGHWPEPRPERGRAWPRITQLPDEDITGLPSLGGCGLWLLSLAWPARLQKTVPMN